MMSSNLTPADHILAGKRAAAAARQQIHRLQRTAILSAKWHTVSLTAPAPARALNKAAQHLDAAAAALDNYQMLLSRAAETKSPC